MSLPFVDRPPTYNEVEKLRLLLSTYQDGSGSTKVDKKYKRNNFLTLPNYNQFERCVATVFGGYANESKEVFDVILKDSSGVEYGLSCKMKAAWSNLNISSSKPSYIYMELANASSDFNEALKKQGLTLNDYTLNSNPTKAGRALLNTVKKWHRQVSIANGGSINIKKSYFLTMVYKYDQKSAKCSLFQLPLALPNPRHLTWHCPNKKEKGKLVPSKRIQGDFKGTKIFDFYGTSGGQLKYYYPLDWPIIWSASFELEKIPEEVLRQDQLSKKAILYFEEAWKKATQ